jgi:hypothetical protein
MVFLVFFSFRQSGNVRRPDNTLTVTTGKKFDPHDPARLCTMARQARPRAPRA